MPFIDIFGLIYYGILLVGALWLFGVMLIGILKGH